MSRKNSSHDDKINRIKPNVQVNLDALQKADKILGGPTQVSADKGNTVSVKKHPIQSLVTTLPVIMLLVGLWFYYSGEKKQRAGELITSQMQLVQGTFSGLSEQGKSAGAQRILWIKTAERLRGGRLEQKQFMALQQVQSGQQLDVWMAPRLAGSKTMWVVKVVASGKVLLEQMSTDK